MRMTTVVCLVILVVICCWFLGPATTVSEQEQKIDMKVIQGGGGGQCPSAKERERAINELHQTVDNIITSSQVPDVCGDNPSGWRRVAFINMTDTSHSCPPGLQLTSYSKRTCGRVHTTNGGCSSTTFDVGGIPYTHVCGRIRGYQFGTTSAFFPFYNLHKNINQNYVGGISLTHGGESARQHIWTFAAGATQIVSGNFNELCPCLSLGYYVVPPFVGNDYFCEGGLHSPWNSNFVGVFIPSNVLWDGQNCISNSTCCQFNSPPWFTKTLNASTTDNIELRLCTYSVPFSEDIPLELIELYVK